VWARSEIPPEWYGGDLSEMEALVEKWLHDEAEFGGDEGFGRSDRKPFSKMGGEGKNVGKRVGKRDGGGLTLRESDWKGKLIAISS